MRSEEQIKSAFESKYSSSAEDPACAEELRYFRDGWITSLSTPPDIPKGAVGVTLTDAQRLDLSTAALCVAAVGGPTCKIEPEHADRIIELLDSLRLSAAPVSPEPAQKMRPDFMAGYDAGMKDGKAMMQRDCNPAFQPAEAVSDDIKRAKQILARLCENGLVQMSIPVRQDDEDMVLSRVIELAGTQAAAAEPAVQSEGERSLVALALKCGAYMPESANPGSAIVFRPAELDAFAAALAAQPPAPQAEPAKVPKGWKLVPVEPTQAMIDAYESTNPEDHWPPKVRQLDGTTTSTRDCDALIYYRAMLGAATMAAEPVAPAKGATVDFPKIGTVPSHMANAFGILALERMAESIQVIDKMACWDHMAMFDVRDALCGAKPVEGAEPPSPSPAERGLSDAEERMLRELFSNMADLSDKDWRDHGFRRATFDRLESKVMAVLMNCRATHPAPASAQAGAVPEELRDELNDIADAIDSYVQSDVVPEWGNIESWVSHLRRLAAPKAGAGESK